MGNLHNQRHFLFIFVDGIGLGVDEIETNPFAQAPMPCLKSLLGGKNLCTRNSPLNGARFSLVPLDACLGVIGMPQSATGQASLMTGKNIPKEIGYHYGPKPNDEIRELVSKGNLFSKLINSNKSAGFLNAYPQRYFDAIQSGRRLMSSIPLAVTSAGIKLNSLEELISGHAISADLTGEGWSNHFEIPNIPILSPHNSGKSIAELSRNYDFSLFEYWLSDYAGHSQEMPYACEILGIIDGMLCGLLSTWKDDDGLILITSDHGNLEDLSTHRHTKNPVPALVIGGELLREEFIKHLENLADITPAILSFLGANA